MLKLTLSQLRPLGPSGSPLAKHNNDRAISEPK